MEPICIILEKKTDKKIGGQKGHSLTKDKVEKMIDDKLVETRTVYHESNNKNGKDVTKYRIGLEVNVYGEKHIFKHNPKTEDKIPKEFYIDETTNNNKWYIRNYSNSETVVYKPHQKKGHKQIEEHNILTKYTGGIMHDHDTAMYKYGSNNYECNIHLGRYLEEIIQNVSIVTWARKLKELISKTYHDRKALIKEGSKSFSDNQFDEINAKYDEIITLAKKENKDIKSSFYKEKAYKLVRRCEKYKDNHLAFIYDFSVPFDNNPSERDLRVIKIKTKISGGFKNIDSATSYCNAISIIKTSIKRKVNPFDFIKSIFNNEVLFTN